MDMRAFSRPVVLLCGALFAWGLWFMEVCWIKGWAGLAWLAGFNWSALPICCLIATMSMYIMDVHSKSRQRWAFVAAASLSMLGGFVACRWAMFEIFSGPTTVRHAFPALVILIGTLIGVSVVLTFAANRWLSPLHRWTTVSILCALIMVMPLSVFTIKAFPALNGSTDTVHSIKMGYPVFWASLLVPLFLTIGRKRLSSR